MNMKPHEKEEYIRRFQEHPTFYEICRFLEHEVARTLPRDFPNWYDSSIEGCAIRIQSIGSDYWLMPHLWSLSLDVHAVLALHKLDLDTPCHTVGDMGAGKLGLISTESIRQYGETHKNQILEWLASGRFEHTIVNKDSVARLKVSEIPTPSTSQKGWILKEAGL